MAFPTIPTVAGNRILFQLSTNPAGTHTSPSLTTLVNNSGDLLIAICIIYDGNSTNAEFSSWGGGFTEFGDFATTATVSIGCAYKFSDGTETGTFTVTSSDTSANDSCFILLSIEGAHASTIPVAGGYATGTAVAADPGSLDPGTWDVEDTLWIAVAGIGETSTGGAWGGVTAAPADWTGYADSGVSADAIGAIEGAVAFLQSAAASVDPGAFTNDETNTRYGAITIAVRPAPQTLTGQTDQALTLSLTTSGTETLKGSSSAGFTFSSTTAGSVVSTRRGLVSWAAFEVPAFVATTYYGAATQALTAGFTTNGARQVTGAATQALTATFTTEGRAAKSGQATQALTLASTTQGTKALRGVATQALTLASTTSAKVTAKAQATQALTATLVTAGRASTFAHPLVDSVDGAWTTQAGGADLAPTLDEHEPDDADYIRSELHPTDSACRLRLEPLIDPDQVDYHQLDWRIAKSAAGGDTIDMEMRLYQGGGNVLGAGTLVATRTASNVSETFTTYHDTLTALEIEAITNYAQLYVEFEATASTTVADRRGQVSWMALHAALSDVHEEFAFVDSSYTFGSITSGTVTRKGTTTSAYTLTLTTQGTRALRGFTVLPLTLTAVTSGLVSAKGASTQALTVTLTTSGAVEGGAETLFGATTTEYTLAVTTSGRLGARGAISIPLVLTETTVGRTAYKGAATQALTLTFTTQGTIAGQETGNVVIALTLASTTQGKITAKGAVVLPLTLSQTATGRLGAKSSVVLPLTLSSTTNGRRALRGFTTSAYTLSLTSQGMIFKRGRIVLPLTLTEVTTGRVAAYGEVVLPLTLDLLSAGAAGGFGQVLLPLTWDALTTGEANLVSYLDAIYTGRIGQTAVGAINGREQGHIADTVAGVLEEVFTE